MERGISNLSTRLRWPKKNETRARDVMWHKQVFTVRIITKHIAHRDARAHTIYYLDCRTVVMTETLTHHAMSLDNYICMCVFT